MHFSSNLAVRGRTARLFLVTATAVTVGGLAACSGGDESVALIRATLKVQSITQQGSCEDVNVKLTPISILPGAPKMSNSKEFVTPVKLTKGADGVSCTGEAATIPMSPGKWRFTANMPSQIAKCERDIPASGSISVGFKDAEESCT